MRLRPRAVFRVTLYCLPFLLIPLLYLSWLDEYRLAHPAVVEAVSASYVEEQPLDGILLWDEQLVYAPQSGAYTYPSPRPRRVSKGEMIAALDGTAVRAPYPAYFYPALDGQEGHWTYSRLWPEFAPFPFFKPAALLEDGSLLRKGAPIGKLVPQPQALRCIAYLDSTPAIERMLHGPGAVLRIKLAPDDKELKAEVVAVKSAGPTGSSSQGDLGATLMGQKIKICLRLPFFPPDLLRSRAFSAQVVTGEQQGVMLPDSAVIVKDGRHVVFLVQGNRAVSQDVDGFPVGGEKFFVVKGLSPGNTLIRDAERMPRDILRIW